ncbi:hypothetical protein KUCAC02_022959 [Chaenocephalus aceratus]|uniref:Uncharacterized protein n=1 Tax=Chaenocephalus aceratus TaxID=36190 RepID=A0ACB9XNH9_CHAAC|nr:hypothetical protein KUCAC02_022959 [Chaenocephalus aceratus]
MPGPQGEYAAVASPVKKSKLSLKFLQKKEAKRALDFSEPLADEPKTVKHVEPEASSCDQRDTLVPFVGLNNLGNTCYLNSILQVLYHCPGLREGIKKLYNLSKSTDKPEETDQNEEQSEDAAEALPPQLELLGSFNSLITSVQQLQSSFLLNPDSFTEGELATPPRKILNTLRQLNPMYEGYLQHDAQEVLQCILGYIQEACDTIRKDLKTEESEVKPEHGVDSAASSTVTEEEDGQVSGKRKSDTEVGNAKKKPKSLKAKKSDAGDNKPLTRSKRRQSRRTLSPSRGAARREQDTLLRNKKTAEPKEGLDLMEAAVPGLPGAEDALPGVTSASRADEEPSSPDDLSEVSPDPKPELKTLKWAIGQFASVERIVGEDKYFCETCHHYTEAERRPAVRQNS